MQRLLDLSLDKNVQNIPEVFYVTTKQEVLWRKRFIGVKILGSHLLLIDNDKIVGSLTQLAIIIVHVAICIVTIFVVVVLHHIGYNFEHPKIIRLARLDYLQGAIVLECVSIL